MSRLSLLVVVLVVVASALAKPAEDTKKDSAVAVPEKKADEKVTTALVDTGSWTTFLTEGNSGAIITGTLATIFILGGFGLGYYYFYYLAYYNNVVGQSAPVSSVDSFSSYPQTYNYPSNFYPATGRAIKGNSSFSFDRVLDMIAMAQELYEKFDFQSIDCQKKALCELQQRTNDFGETGRQIQGTLSFYVSRSFVEALEDLPMPKVIQTYLKEYKDALIQGKNSSKDCGITYPKCSSSVRDVFVKYSKKVQKI